MEPLRMKKKKLMGAKILGSLLVIIGSTGFFRGFHPSVENYKMLWQRLIQSQGFREGEWISWMIILVPFVIVVIAGIGLIFSKEWARKITLFFLIPLAYPFIVFWFYLYEGAEMVRTIFLGYAILIASPVTVPLMVYLNRSKVKAHFKSKQKTLA
jgi:hypothetical protein